MKTMKISIIVWFVFLLTACNPLPPTPYQYISNPEFTWGYAEFYGKYFGNYNCNNNVLTISLLSKYLKVDKTKNLVGVGQYLILEDVFVNPTDTLLPAGTYKLDDTKAPFTFLGGKEYKETGTSKGIPSGAYIYYMESDVTKSKIAYVTAGTFDVSIQNDTIYHITCNFTLDGEQELKGTFKNVLYHFDESAKTSAMVKRERRYLLKF